jgi:D-serine deaminase-like pyridoxal phosphate-dependent protein
MSASAAAMFVLPAPARPGMRVEEVDTPALLLDLDAFERNLRRLNATLAGRSVRVRPHAKSHKCPQIALRQVALGAVGVCCQKVSEAQALVQGGVRDVLVANEVVGAGKLQRLAALAHQARIGVCVDDADNVRELAAAVRAAGSRVDVYIEVDVGARRCGVESGAPALALARAVADAGLHFAGIQAYQGAAQHLRTPAERRSAVSKAVEMVQATAAALRDAGLAPGIITGAGTGTYLLEAGSGVYNELQPGSYIFMDADYGRNLGDDGLPVHEFEQSLFILATVMSRPVPARAVVDVGLKAHSVDSGMPAVAGIEGARYTRASDEHGVIELSAPAQLRLGQKIRLVPGHCDPTVNLYDWLVCYRGDQVEDLWPISARGAFY